MKGLRLVKKAGGQFIPAFAGDKDRCTRIKTGSLVFADIHQPPNPENRARLFVMLNFAYDYWNPELKKWEGIEEVKTPERFREEILILAGHWMTVGFRDGATAVVAKSVSVKAIPEEEVFNALYKNVFAVIWKFVLSKIDGMEESEMENIAQELMRYE